VDEVVMGTMGVHSFQQSWTVKMDSFCVQLATYKLSLPGES